MISSFSTLKLGELIPKLTKALEETNYSSKEPILKELNVETLSDAISILSSELSKYLERNFLPIAAQLTMLLSQCHRLDGNYEKWLSLILNCLSPNYQRFLPSSFQELAVREFQEIPDEIYVDLENSNFLPFNIDVGFSSSKAVPSTKLSVISSFASLIPVKMQVNKVLIQVVNEKTLKSFDAEVFDNFEVIQNKKEKSVKEIKRLKPGQYIIKSVKISVSKALIIVPAKSVNHYTKVQILPYEMDTKFSIETNSISITNFPYPVKVNLSCLPPETTDVIIKVKTSDSCCLENGENESEVTITEFETQYTNKKEKFMNASVSKDFIIISKQNGDSDINVKWIIHYDTEQVIEHEENLHVIFHHAFLPTFKIYGPNRIPFNLARPPTLRKGTEYAFITTFEYNLSYPCEVQSVTIQDIVHKENECNVNIKSMPIEMPINISQSEGLTFAAFLSFLETTPINQLFEPCEITIKFRVNCNENGFIYRCKLPEIQLEERNFDCYISCENDDSEKGKENTMILNFECNSADVIGKDAVVKISQNQFFEIKESIHTFTVDEKGQISFGFTPLESGTRSFPKISIYLADDDKTPIWESAPFFITK